MGLMVHQTLQKTTSVNLNTYPIDLSKLRHNEKKKFFEKEDQWSVENLKGPYMHIIGVLSGDESWRTEELFEELVAKAFSNLFLLKTHKLKKLNETQRGKI